MNGTTRKITPADIAYAERLIMAGASVQSAVMMTGVGAESLAGVYRPARASYVPPPPPARFLCGKIKPDLTPAPCSPATLAIIQGVADRYDIKLSDILGPRAYRRFSYPRHEAMAKVRAARGLSLPQIGRIFGGRDHTTVLIGIRSYHARAAWAELLIWAGRVEDYAQPDLFAVAA